MDVDAVSMPRVETGCRYVVCVSVQMDILCTHPMFGPDSGKGSWQGLNFMYEKVRIGSGANRSKRVGAFLQVGTALAVVPFCFGADLPQGINLNRQLL